MTGERGAVGTQRAVASARLDELAEPLLGPGGDSQFFFFKGFRHGQGCGLPLSRGQPLALHFFRGLVGSPDDIGFSEREGGLGLGQTAIASDHVALALVAHSHPVGSPVQLYPSRQLCRHGLLLRRDTVFDTVFRYKRV